MSDAIYLEIAVACPLRRSFDYLPPSNEQDPPLAIGQRVIVPFGRRQVLGVILAIKSESRIAPQQLKSIHSLLDENPALTPSLIKLLSWAAHYYQAPVGELVFSALPGPLREPKAFTNPLTSYSIKENHSLHKFTKTQQNLLTFLKTHKTASLPTLLAEGFKKTTLTSLTKKDILLPKEPSLATLPPCTLKEQPPTLNEDQQKAVTTITKNLENFHTYLLDGVTGSGKTEVYLQVMHAVLSLSKQVLILVPEISLTPQTITRFKQRFNVPLAVLHSGLSDHERYLNWEIARTHQAGIIVGTRSSILTPLKNLGLVVIDEEHDLSFKQQEGVRYFARDLGIYRAYLDNIPIILGSATPSLESFHNTDLARYTYLNLPARAGLSQMPAVQLLDLRKNKPIEGLTPAVVKMVGQYLERKEQVLFFINRRGFAPILTCHDCGWVANCKLCDKPYTLHAKVSQLHCHFCEVKKSLPSSCADCQSETLKPLGFGTERLEHTLTQKFPEARIARIDRDNVKHKDQLNHYMDNILNDEYQILIGTQMLTKGHHFPNVTLVVIVDADAGLFSHDFRATERMGQLITQVAGRAGRAEKPGRVVIQTRHPEHPLLNTLLELGFKSFAKTLLDDRKATHLPPFSYLALLRAEAINPLAAINFLKNALSYRDGSVNFLGPIPAPMARRKGYHRAQLLLQTTNRKALEMLLPKLIQHLEQQKKPKNLHWSIDRDPQEMF